MTETEWKAMVKGSENITTLGQIIVWNANNHRNYHDAHEAGATYLTSSSMDVLSDLESSASGFLDLMEVLDVMNECSHGQDYGFGITYEIDSNYGIYIELDIIRHMVNNGINRTAKDTVLHALDVYFNLGKHKSTLRVNIAETCIESFIYPFKIIPLKS
ncbi:hypothetical protein ACP3V3_19735 [Vibrio sp. PNB22_3_1]